MPAGRNALLIPGSTNLRDNLPLGLGLSEVAGVEMAACDIGIPIEFGNGEAA